ncbi:MULTISPECIES: alpha/beta hydrolase family protein [Flavobacteriaceae]|uniref:Uncharacterized protein n=1 Tax=Pseudozobellia thermophila TaxID=192903 RepID=A0A1M6EBK1_9FLAO|nr:MULTISPECIES: hypothetical protein [Flavobacteriaceae]MDO6516740.1 hypothetical protein [Zobellia uliginosa]SHI82749.1 hypothetical protein SAMN04488513_1022 [Pseudozobellia thermophila]
MILTEHRSQRWALKAMLEERHHYYEMMAKWPYDFVKDVASFYWRDTNQSEFTVGIDLNKIQLAVYLPNADNRDNVHPVLAFHGTGLEQLTDIKTDLNLVSTGLDKYIEFEFRISKIIQEISETYSRKIIVIGYSLGGCYAQYTYLRNWIFVKNIITFQSPMIASYLESILLLRYGFNIDDIKLKQQKDGNAHYLVYNDPVPDLARRWVESPVKYVVGNLWIFKFNQNLGPIDAHKKLIFDEFISHDSSQNERKSVYINRNLNRAVRLINSIEHISIPLDGLGQRDSIKTRIFEDRKIAFNEAITKARSPRRAPLDPRALIALGIVSFFQPDRIVYYIIALWNNYSLEFLRYKPRPGTARYANLINLRNRVLSSNPNDDLNDYQKNYLKEIFLSLSRQLSQRPGNRYMTYKGHLTNIGLEVLKENANPRSIRNKSDELILEIFNEQKDPNSNYDNYKINQNSSRYSTLRYQWRELLVSILLKDYYYLVPFENGTNTYFKPPLTYPLGSQSNRDFQKRSQKVFMIRNVNFNTILNRLPGILNHYKNEYDSDYNSGEIAFTIDLNNTNDLNISDAYIYNFLHHVMNEDSSIEGKLVSRYYRAHSYYIDGLKQDPLRLLSDSKRKRLFSDDEQLVNGVNREFQESYNIETFKEEAKLVSGRTRRIIAKTKNRQKLGEWYSHLFAGFTSNREEAIRGGMIATNFFGNREDLPSGIIQDDVINFSGGRLVGLKKVGNSIPDILLIWPERHLIWIIDPTYRYDVPWHNFKTSYYISVIKKVLQDWTVEGVDYRDDGRFTRI